MTEGLRFAHVVKLRPNKRETYLSLHAAVWPGVEAAISRSNIQSYTIWLHEDLLFSTYLYVGDDYAADVALLGSSSETQRWWSVVMPCQERLPGTPEGEQWLPLSEVWHLD